MPSRGRLNRLLLYAILLTVWAIMPLLLSPAALDRAVIAALLCIGGLGVAMLLGQTGILSLSQSVFYGIGAYSTGILTSKYGWPNTLALLAGLGIACSLAYIIGKPILRLTGLYLALATLSLAIIGSSLFYQWQWLTGGTLGLGGIPYIQIGGFVFDRPEKFYYLAWGIALAVIWGANNVVGLRAGLAIRAVRQSPAAASSLGIDISAVRTQVFVFSAGLGALAGSLFAHYTGFISAYSFGVDRGIQFVLLAVVGGIQSPFGSIPGAIFVSYVPDLFSQISGAHQVFYGLSLVLVVLFAPRGLSGIIGDLLDKISLFSGMEGIGGGVRPTFPTPTHLGGEHEQ